MPTTNPTLTPDEALAVLLEGAERAALDRPLRPNSDKSRRELLRKEQHPIAAVVGCSDSRVPMEYAFDVGYGDLFAIRTAGHTLGETVIGSIEFAVEVLQVPLVMVLGHTSCGAVDAAKATFDSGDTPQETSPLSSNAFSLPWFRPAKTQPPLDSAEPLRLTPAAP